VKIGVVSDTHSLAIPQQMLDDFQDADLIIHSGDFCSIKELDIFRKIAKVKAVWGNMDDAELHKILPETLVFETGGLSIGLYHGCGPRNRVLDFVQKKFKDEKLDAVIYGHTHLPFNEVIDQCLYFNPGSPNDTIYAPYCSYGILEIKGGKIKGKLIKIK